MDCMWHVGSSTISWRVKYLLVYISIESVMLSNHLILCYPLLLLPSIFPSIRAFCSELALPVRWPKYWSFSFSISPSSEYSGWFSWMFFLNKGRQVWSPWSPRDSQESFPASTTSWKHQFFDTQPFLWSNSHIHTWWLEKKNIGLTIWTFLSKVMFLLFYMLSRFICCLLISSKEQVPFNFMVAVTICSDFGAQ